MSSMTRILSASAALALSLLALPVAALDGADAPDIDPVKAAQLHAQAAALFDTPARWSEAADLLVRSVVHRAPADPQIHTSLMIAAAIRVTEGRLAEGSDLAERAGESALARGAVLAAAHSFMSAAGAAAQGGNAQRAEDLIERARLLAGSPLLEESERRSILARDGSSAPAWTGAEIGTGAG